MPKIPGVNFLEHKLKTYQNEVVRVDKSEWERVISFFRTYPDAFDKMIKEGNKPRNNEMETKL